MIRQLHYLGLLLPLFTTSSWAAEQNSSVHIAPAGSHTAVYGSAENFIGRVRVDPLFNADNDIRVSAAYVTFEPGARSAWHTHPAGQRLKVRRMVVKDFRTYSCAADSPRILSISRVGVMPDVPL